MKLIIDIPEMYYEFCRECVINTAYIVSVLEVTHRFHAGDEWEKSTKEAKKIIPKEMIVYLEEERRGGIQ